MAAEGALRKAEGKKYPGFTYEKEGEWRGPFCFIHAADTQFGLIDSWNEVPPEEQTWEKEIVLTRKAISAANKLSPKPRFFVVCGDLVNAFPCEKFNTSQVEDFKGIFKELDANIPLVCVCGNHDIGDSPTQQSLEKYKSNFGDDFYSFWVGGVFFLVLNSQFYKEASQVMDYKLEQDKWLDKQLALLNQWKPKHVVVFQHIPWFFGNPQEKDHYFNIETNLRIQMLAKFKNAGVKYVFAGHYHRNAGGFDEDLEMIITSAVGQQINNDKGSGMRIVTVTQDKIAHAYHELDSVPSNVAL